MRKIKASEVVLGGIAALVLGLLYSLGADIYAYMKSIVTVAPNETTLPLNPQTVISVALVVGGILAVAYGFYLKRQETESLKTQLRSLELRRIESAKYALPERPTRIRVEKKVFENQDVYIDGHSWIDCKFIRCNIIVERGDFDLVSNEFDSCRLSARGSAEGIIRLAKTFFPNIPIVESSIKAQSDIGETESKLAYLKLGFQLSVKRDLLELEKQLNFSDPKPIHFKSWNETEDDMRKQLLDNKTIYGIVENIAKLFDEWNKDLDRASLLMLEPGSSLHLYIQGCEKYYEKLREIGFLS